jgi:hypothetical protein
MSDFDFPVFGPDGKLMGNLTSSQGVPNKGNALYDFDSTFSAFPAAVPAIAAPFAPSETSPGAKITSSGSGAGAAGEVTAANPSTATVPSNAAASASPSPAGGIVSGSLIDYFLRAVIIILGFIFVAVGLNMFRPGTVPVPRVGR